MLIEIFIGLLWFGAVVGIAFILIRLGGNVLRSLDNNAPEIKQRDDSGPFSNRFKE